MSSKVISTPNPGALCTSVSHVPAEHIYARSQCTLESLVAGVMMVPNMGSSNKTPRSIWISPEIACGGFLMGAYKYIIWERLRVYSGAFCILSLSLPFFLSFVLHSGLTLAAGRFLVCRQPLCLLFRDDRRAAPNRLGLG